MANVVLTLRVMPESPNTDLAKLEIKIKKKILNFVGKVAMKFERVPLAFGINSLNIIFVADESSGAPDSLVEDIGKLDGVNSAEIVDARRAIG